MIRRGTCLPACIRALLRLALQPDAMRFMNFAVLCSPHCVSPYLLVLCKGYVMLMFLVRCSSQFMPISRFNPHKYLNFPQQPSSYAKPLPRFPLVMTLPFEPPSHSSPTVSTMNFSPLVDTRRPSR